MENQTEYLQQLLNKLKARIEELDAATKKLVAENEELKAARAGDQQRLFHYERLFADMKVDTLRDG